MTDDKNIQLTPVLFEYPLQENVRGFLRLEYLFKQYHRNLLSSNQDNHCYCLRVLFEILEILERGDTRSELIKELIRLLDYFQALKDNPDVDSSKLDNFLTQVKQLHQWVNNYQGKFGETIRTNPFLMTVKQRTNIPGGSSQFDCPELHLFLKRAHSKRQQQLNEIISDIKGVETSVEVILRLIRESGTWSAQKAPMGSFMIETSHRAIRLLRIKATFGIEVFPEFSCGKHRSSVHFMSFNSVHKKMPVNSEVEFELACCS
ncbi:MAG: cell division protein ZapD [Kangiellaceae bacterium]|nr:cell division protein ZapD [Kangiellaceae bacterium]